MSKGLKNEIIKLKKEGKKYDEITKVLNCSKATVSYHCNKNGLGQEIKFTEEIKIKLNEYYKNHTTEETSKKFNCSMSAVVKYTDNKNIPYTKEEKAIANYNSVKNFRQRTKVKAIEYKGGKCSKCGYNKSNWALEFHHLDPNEKDFGIAQYKVLNWKKIKIELDKCILVCSNCHKEIHEEEYINSIS